MRKLFVFSVIAAIVGIASSLVAEDLPPISLGSGQSSTQHANGQIVEISISGPVQVTVYFDKVQPEVVNGLVMRTSGGTSAGSVTVRWINTGVEKTLSLSAGNPTQSFSLEGGDGDKRAPGNRIN